jgi:hypothetical protein
MQLIDLITCGLPTNFIVCASAMVLTNQLSLTVNEIRRLTRVDPPEADHFGMVVRSKRIGTYKSGLITITDQRYLDLAESLARPPKTAPEPCKACEAREAADQEPKGPEIFYKPKKAPKAGGAA